MKKISLIILTYNSFSAKGGCVRHCLEAAANHVDQICIADNSSNAADVQALANFVGSRPYASKVTIIKTNNIDRGAARNQAVKQCSGEYLFFLDDDTIVLNPQAFDIINSPLNPTFGFAAKRLWTKPDKWFEAHTEAILDELQQGSSELLASNSAYRTDLYRGINLSKSAMLCSMRTYISNFGFVERDVFEQIGGFSEELAGYGCEDDTLQFHLFGRCGQPYILDEYAVAHIDHDVSPVAVEEFTVNRAAFDALVGDNPAESYPLAAALFGNYRINL